MDLAWALFAEATLQQAVRTAAREGITRINARVQANMTDTIGYSGNDGMDLARLNRLANTPQSTSYDPSQPVERF